VAQPLAGELKRRVAKGGEPLEQLLEHEKIGKKN
jgi:hypothetical protein